MSKHGEGYTPGVPSVTELLEAAGYYDAYRFVEDRQFYLDRGSRVNDICDAVALYTHDFAEVSSDIRGFIDAYFSWLSRYPRRKLIDVQSYVHHKTLGYQGTYDQRWILEPGQPETILDIKCVADGAHCQKCTALQLAAYDDALGPLISGVAGFGNPNPYYLTHRKRLGLALHSDGTFYEDWYTNWRDYPNWRNLVTYHQIHDEKGEYR